MIRSYQVPTWQRQSDPYGLPSANDLGENSQTVNEAQHIPKPAWLRIQTRLPGLTNSPQSPAAITTTTAAVRTVAPRSRVSKVERLR